MPQAAVHDYGWLKPKRGVKDSLRTGAATWYASPRRIPDDTDTSAALRQADGCITIVDDCHEVKISKQTF